MRKLEERGLLEKHALANGLRVEVPVAADFDGHQLVALAGRDQVIDGGLIVDDALLLELHLGVEIAVRLEIIAQVARAFDQQVVIHGVFLEDRDVAPQLSLGDLGAGGAHLDARPGVDAERGKRAVGRGIVLQGIQRDLGFQAILLFIHRADPFDALRRRASG